MPKRKGGADGGAGGTAKKTRSDDQGDQPQQEEEQEEDHNDNPPPSSMASPARSGRGRKPDTAFEKAIKAWMKAGPAHAAAATKLKECNDEYEAKKEALSAYGFDPTKHSFKSLVSGKKEKNQPPAEGFAIVIDKPASEEDAIERCVALSDFVDAYAERLRASVTLTATKKTLDETTAEKKRLEGEVADATAEVEADPFAV